MWTNSMVLILQYTSDQSNVWYTLSLHGICQLYLKILNEFLKTFHWVEHLEMANSIHSGTYLKKKQIQVRSVVVAAAVQLLSCVHGEGPHGLQHTRLPRPLPSPGACSNSCPLSRWCHPTISSSLVPFSSCLQIFPSIRVFSNESVLCIRWPKYWSFSFSISLPNEYSGLISFRMDWLDLLAVQGTLKSLL